MGGAPAFGQPLYVGRPNAGDRSRFLHRIGEIFDSRWFTNNGPFLKQFEATIARYIGVRNCVATCNATIGLEATISALQLTGSVVVPSFTFVATAHALQRSGISPIFCDVDPETYTLDARKAEAAIRSDTSGLLGVHLWGRTCNVEALQELAHRRGLKLFFDAAQAFGCTYDGRPIGCFGRAEVLSFHATKAINSFEGGAVVTDDDELASKVRLIINFGFSDYDRVSCLGFNGKMSEPCAAMGITSIESMQDIFDHNRRNYDLYRAGLLGIPGLTVGSYDRKESSNYHYVVVKVDAARFGLNRDHLQRVLMAENVMARRYFYPGCHRSEPYLSLPANAELCLPVTDALCTQALCLPTGTSVGQHEIAQICNVISLASKGVSLRSQD